MVFTLLLVYSLFVRFPFFFRDYIDRDESTFILVGQSLVDGQLPYMLLWDLKPPVIFYFFASIIYFLGKSFIAVRLVGVIAVVCTAFCTFKLSARLTSVQTGFWIALVCVMLLSMFGSLQGLMSEHICMLFFMPAIYLLVRSRQPLFYFLAGILVGLSVMTKLNMAYPGLFLGAYIVIDSLKKRGLILQMALPLLYASGIFLIVFLTFLPYYVQGIGSKWWNSVILASIEYSASRRQSILSLSPIFILTGFLLYLSWRNRWLDFRNRDVHILIVVLIGVLFSYLKAGRVNGHYLIQIHPILVILIGSAVYHWRKSLNWKAPFLRYCYLLPLLIPVEAYVEYVAVVRNKIVHGTFYNGEGIRVPQYLFEHKVDTRNILFFEYHIGYWLLGQYPPSKAATHPSNICRDEIYPYFDNPRRSSMEELHFLLTELRPAIIVVRANRPVFDPLEVEENHYVASHLERHYRLLTTLDQASIYQLSE